MKLSYSPEGELKTKRGDALEGGNRCEAVESRQRLNQPQDLQPEVNGLQFRDQSLGPLRKRQPSLGRAPAPCELLLLLLAALRKELTYVNP
jgi:hypothetical protein